MLEKIKVLLGITDTSKDALISILLDKSIEYAIAYTHNHQCIPYIQGALIDMTVYTFNRLGTEGLTGESYSGVNFSYTDDFPPQLLRQLNAYRKVRVV